MENRPDKNQARLFADLKGIKNALSGGFLALLALGVQLREPKKKQDLKYAFSEAARLMSEAGDLLNLRTPGSER